MDEAASAGIPAITTAGIYPGVSNGDKPFSVLNLGVLWLGTRAQNLIWKVI